MTTTKQIKQKKKESRELRSFQENTVYIIELSKIVPSPFEPQARRRNRFTDAELEDLGLSLKIKQIHPILLRKKGEMFEIVAGERRFLASQKVALPTIKAIIEDLSDLQVIELQYQENHQRVDNNPLDDAFTFKYLQEKENLSVDQLAEKFNLGKTTIAERLKLNDLIPEVAEQIENGTLPLKHAYYLAKFPDTAQKEIVRENYAYRYGSIAEGAIPFNEFKEEVEENILRRLETAPFDTSDKRLHLKGLICANCQERSGFSPLLFPDLQTGDSCLNKSCFESKTNIHLRLKRDEIAEKLPNPENLPIEKIVEKVPIVTSRAWAEETPFKVKPLTNQTFLDESECISSEPALIADGEKKGQETFICRDESCDIHYPKAGLDKAESAEGLSEAKRRSLELDFNRKVSNRLRLEVFKKAMNFFGSSKVFFIYADLVARLVSELLYFNRSVITGDLKKELFANWKNVPSQFDDKEKNLDFALSLNIDESSKILFLLVYSDELYFRPSDTEIKQIAEFYARPFNYAVRQAEIRLELAPDEFKKLAEDYYHKIFTGELPPDSPPPFWYESEEE